MRELTEQEKLLCRRFTVNGRLMEVVPYTVPGFVGRVLGTVFTVLINGEPMRGPVVPFGALPHGPRRTFCTVDEARSAGVAACLWCHAAG